MELYLIKSAACLAILFLFYKLALENSALHTTKRIYLLVSTLLSFTIPLITFTQYVEIAPIAANFTEIPVATIAHQAIETQAAPINYTPMLLWTVYGIGVLFFSIRFARNLFSMLRKIRQNPSVKSQSIFYVLLQLPVTPHSFLNYIFFSKTAFEAREIPEEVLIHEQTHVRQKHSWDLLCIEVLRIVFWFNPLLYFIKHSIQLNHEFLADRAVLQSGTETTAYQNIILDFSSTSGVPQMAHSINYSSPRLNELFSKGQFGQVKKRFTVMKTHTSKRAAWLKSLIILPLLAVLIYGFSTTKTLEKVIPNPNDSSENPEMQPAVNVFNNTSNHLTARSISIHFLNESTLEVDGVEIEKNKLQSTLESLHKDITKEQRNRLMNIHVTADGEVQFSDLVFLHEVARRYGYHRIITPNEEIVRSKENTPAFSDAESAVQNQYASEYLDGATRNGKKAFVLQIELSEIRLNGIPIPLTQFANQLDAYTEDWSATDYTSAHPSILVASTPTSFLQKVDAEFKKTLFSKANSRMSLLASHQNALQKKATAAQLAEYNKLAKKYNSMPRDNMRVKGKELTRMYYLYDVMTIEQRKKAEPFPSFPPPPPAPDAHKASKNPKPPKPPKPPKVKKGSKNDNTPPPPPPPPKPQEPLDHVISMAKKGATFYFENKKISSDEAINLVKKNKDLNISSQTSNGVAVVRISKNGIKIDD